jgi:hypothetical protein
MKIHCIKKQFFYSIPEEPGIRFVACSPDAGYPFQAENGSRDDIPPSVG